MDKASEAIFSLQPVTFRYKKAGGRDARRVACELKLFHLDGVMESPPPLNRSNSSIAAMRTRVSTGKFASYAVSM